MSKPFQFSPFNGGDDFFIMPDGLPYSSLDFLIGYMVFVRDAPQPSVASHFLGLKPSL
jgi:hypothetical protein